jgi:hypothetical protein
MALADAMARLSNAFLLSELVLSRKLALADGEMRPGDSS